MKKIVVLFGIVCLGALAATAKAAPKKITISNTRIVQPAQKLSFNYGGVQMVVPQGQAILLGQRSDGAVVVRGHNLSGIQVGNSLVSTQGYSVFSIDPKNNVVFLNRGTELTLQDPAGTTATIYPGQAVSAENAAVTSETAPALQAAAQKEAAVSAEVIGAADELPDFVAQSAMTSAAAEQAERDVIETEEVLSPSAP